MITRELVSKYFHAGLIGPHFDESLEIEECIEGVLSNSRRYLVDTQYINAAQQVYERGQDHSGLSKTNSFNPNSNKDVAARIESLHAGLTIPKTSKGNISITKDWLELHCEKNSFINSVLEWRNANRKLQAISQMGKYISHEAGHNWLSTTWRSYAENGSGRMVSEACAISNIPMDLRGAFIAPEGFQWVSMDIRHMDLFILAELSHDGALLRDLNAEDPLVSIGARLGGIADQQTVKVFLNAFLYEFTTEVEIGSILGFTSLDFLQVAYPDLYNYLDSKIHEVINTKILHLGWKSRSRNFEWDPVSISGPHSNLKQKVLASVCQQNMALAFKIIMAESVKSEPSLRDTCWIPGHSELAVLCPVACLSDVAERFVSISRGLTQAKPSVLTGRCWTFL